MHGYLSRRVGALADDLVSETFLQAFRGRTGYVPGRAPVRAWLFGRAAEFTMIREHGPAPAPLSDDVLAKARADLMTEIAAATTSATRRPVRLRRRAVIIAATVAASAVAAGVVAIGGTDTPAPPSPVDKAPVLVEFHMPTLPRS